MLNVAGMRRRLVEGKRPLTRALGESGRRESNSRSQLGKLMFYL
jgi:hypothetical protein